MPSTAYFLACIYAYIGKKVTNVGELQDALADVKAMMPVSYTHLDVYKRQQQGSHEMEGRWTHEQRSQKERSAAQRQ